MGLEGDDWYIVLSDHRHGMIIDGETDHAFRASIDQS